MTRGLGSLQRSILSTLERDPDQIRLYDDIAAEIFGSDYSPVQRQALFNAMRTLARRGLVELQPYSLTAYGMPEARHRVRLA
jgi:hypothetical protein